MQAKPAVSDEEGALADQMLLESKYEKNTQENTLLLKGEALEQVILSAKTCLATAKSVENKNVAIESLYPNINKFLIVHTRQFWDGDSVQLGKAHVGISYLQRAGKSGTLTCYCPLWGCLCYEGAEIQELNLYLKRAFGWRNGKPEREVDETPNQKSSKTDNLRECAELCQNYLAHKYKGSN